MLERTQNALTLIGSIMLKRGCINDSREPREPDVANGHDCSPFTINGPTRSEIAIPAHTLLILLCVCV